MSQKQAQIGNWKVDIASNTFEWSDKVYEIHGLTRETYRPEIETAIQFYHPDDRKYVEKAVAEAIDIRRDIEFERRLIRADGEVRRVISRGRPEFDKDGNLRSIIGIFQDVTDRRGEEQTILRPHARLRAHVENTPLGVLEWDRDFCVVEWNGRCEEIFGYSKEEALGMHASKLLPQDDVYELISGVFAELLAQTGGTHSTNENITKSGEVITCDWYNTPIRNLSGQAVAVASIVEDISARKRLEAQLVQSQKMEAVCLSRAQRYLFTSRSRNY